MNKWYEKNVNDSSILSSRIRLARNLKGKKFPITASDDERIQIIEEVAKALSHYENADSLSMQRTDMMDGISKLSLIDKHIISPALAYEKKPTCTFMSRSERLSVMVLEEDHIRIQAVEAGGDISAPYEQTNKIDNMIDEFSEYAFDEAIGYLTSCPTNAGTGLRASFMLHLPYLEAYGHIGSMANSISKFGYTMRGTFGEGTEAYGSVYQVSNQVTLGLTEAEIIDSLKSLTEEITEKEKILLESDLMHNRLMAEDKVCRIYGILSNARQITEKEAINSLSVLKTGALAGIIDKKLPNIYELLINIRTSTLQKNYGIEDIRQIPEVRAKYLRDKLNGKGD